MSAQAASGSIQSNTPLLPVTPAFRLRASGGDSSPVSEDEITNARHQKQVIRSEKSQQAFELRKQWSAASATMVDANAEDHEDVLMIENDGGILVSEFNNNSGSKLL